MTPRLLLEPAAENEFLEAAGGMPSAARASARRFELLWLPR